MKISLENFIKLFLFLNVVTLMIFFFRTGFNYIERSAAHPLLLGTKTLACYFSALEPVLVNQPDQLKLAQDSHIEARLSADA